ncbi:MAG: TmrB protein [Chloroflexi bacterium]|nr:TmrB protein [Chloroflexota bacterium]
MPTDPTQDDQGQTRPGRTSGMIIVINGPFGVGKSVTAHLLVGRLAGAIVYDPEIIGFILRRVGRPLIKVADYQDLALWRRLTIVGAWALRRPRRTLVIPMAIWRRDYFAHFVGGLRRVDPDVHRFRLTATEETLRQRILASSDQAARSWRLDHIKTGLAAAADPAFGTEVRTEGRTPAEVVDTVLHILEQLKPATSQPTATRRRDASDT